MQKKKLISIVTPCYNEEDNVTDHFNRVTNALGLFGKKYSFEFIYMDNHSNDKTFDILSKMAKKNKQFKVIRFSRNIGANRSIFIGLSHAKGQAAILIQADLQDPPEVIPQFITWWEKGFDVVYGRINKRYELFFIRLLRQLYYKLVTTLSDIEIPQDVGEFRIMSRRVLNAVSQYSEDDIYLRGVIAHVGYKQKGINYNRAKRTKGKSSMNFFSLSGYAINGLLSSTVIPLRLALFVGFFFSIIGFALTVYIVGAKIIFPEEAPQGFTTLGTVITMFAGVQLFAIGIIGEYIRKIYTLSLRRPQGFIEERINI